MSYNSKDGKIHLNYAMLRTMFFDLNGDIKNKELLELIEMRELKYKNYSESSNPVKMAIRNIPKLEEFMISLGDIYNWIRLHRGMGDDPA
ncbi:MAG: hypothetical protein LBS81_03780 [Endomicrobium sp.]|jgi:hypothetical protein|nr:hypothetical protein [Endomicrobium sp.]